MGTFREYQVRLAPPWLAQDLNGAAFEAALGDVKDELVDRAKRAVKSRFPGIAPADALAAIGSERGISRRIDESLADYAERLRRAWEAWPWSGTARGLLLELKAAGYTNAVLMSAQTAALALNAADELVVTTLPAGGWNSRGRSDFWSDFQVLLPAPHRWAGSVTETVAADGAAPTLIPGGKPTAGAHTVRVTGRLAGTRTVLGGTASVTVLCDGLSAVVDPVPRHGVLDVDALTGSSSGVLVTIGGSWNTSSHVEMATAGAFPADDAATVVALKRLVSEWKPAHVTCQGVVVHLAGQLAGWPLGLITEKVLGPVGVDLTKIWTVP